MYLKRVWNLNSGPNVKDRRINLEMGLLASNEMTTVGNMKNILEMFYTETFALKLINLFIVDDPNFHNFCATHVDVNFVYF